MIVLIGEVAKRLDIPVDTLRYYDRIGLVSPMRHGQTRRYREEDIRRLRAIRKMKQLMFSLDEIRALLAADEQVDRSMATGCADVAAMEALLDLVRVKLGEIEAMEDNLRWVKAELERLMAKIEGAMSGALVGGGRSG
jgi:DNA-binding transcriptional MerR regulator